MKLAIFNGSPRGTGSNTTILLGYFLKGFNKSAGCTYTLSYLNETAETDRHVSEFNKADACLLAFPLYTDAMPGIVKHFIEALAGFDGNGEKRLCFLIQSGFPEAVHCSFLEVYLEKLTRRLNCVYVGTIIKGGVEGMQLRKPFMDKLKWIGIYIGIGAGIGFGIGTAAGNPVVGNWIGTAIVIAIGVMKRTFLDDVTSLGRAFGANGAFDPKTLAKFHKPFRFSFGALTMMKALRVPKVINMGIKLQLKKNNALDHQFDQPYKG